MSTHNKKALVAGKCEFKKIKVDSVDSRMTSTFKYVYNKKQAEKICADYVSDKPKNQKIGAPPKKVGEALNSAEKASAADTAFNKTRRGKTNV